MGIDFRLLSEVFLPTSTITAQFLLWLMGYRVTAERAEKDAESHQSSPSPKLVFLQSFLADMLFSKIPQNSKNPSLQTVRKHLILVTLIYLYLA